VNAAFARTGAVYLVADWTNRDAAIAEALGKQGRIGVPLYLVYGADGGEPQFCRSCSPRARRQGGGSRRATRLLIPHPTVAALLPSP